MGVVDDGTLVKFREWPHSLGIEVAGQLGRVAGHYAWGLHEVRYHVDVGPGWGVSSHYRRADFKLAQ